MDDDLTFGASVWGAEEPSPIAPPTKLKPASLPLPLEVGLTSSAPDTNANGDDDFDDFDDFGPAETGAAGQDVVGDDDDFGDFGDFGEANEEIAVTPADFSEIPVAGPSTSRIDSDWEPLRLDPLPSRQRLEQEINEILEPVWDDERSLEQVLTKDGIRDVEGVNQILVTNERCFIAVSTISVLNSDVRLSIVESCISYYSGRHPLRNLQTGLDLEYGDSILSHWAYRSTWTRCYHLTRMARLFLHYKSLLAQCLLHLGRGTRQRQRLSLHLRVIRGLGLVRPLAQVLRIPAPPSDQPRVNLVPSRVLMKLKYRRS